MKSTRTLRFPGHPAGFRRSERGQALIEFAIVIPVVILILLAGADLLTAISAKHNIEYVAEETALCAATLNPSCTGTQVQTYAQQIASSLGLTNASSLTATNNTCSGCASVTVTYPAVPLFAGFFPTINLRSTAQHTNAGS